MLKTRLTLLLFAFLLSSSLFAQKSSVVANYDNILHNVAKMIEVVHYHQPVYDDAFSRKLFRSYFETLDPNRMIFLQEDLRSFQRFETLLDDELRGGKVSFFKAVDTVYSRRIRETRELVNSLLAGPLVVSGTNEVYEERDSANFPASAKEKVDEWRKYITYQVLNHYDDITSSDSASNIKVTDTAAERRARETVARIQSRWFDRLQQQAVEEENFSKYLNAMFHLMDPHSAYYLPVDKREFQEDLSGIYYGIGALLQDVDGKVRIGELMIGGPAWRSGQVEKGDVITAVAQEGEKAVNVEGYGIPEVVKLTRGKKNSRLTITFRKADGSLKQVTMLRDALQLEDTFVRSAVIEDSVRLGYVYVPKFYTNFGDQNGRSCAQDLAVELEKLKKEDVKGIIIDIRDNGGGSLEEVIKMVGLFIQEGPVVQVKSRDKDPEVASISNPTVAYAGPLVVLVNELSASASEIFAAAIQDYKRGVIIGSPSTFGKGTVQRGYRVPGANWRQSETDLGSVHLTLQKYYRVNGDATQLKGIVPDITLPGLYQFYKMQEKNFPNALPWDEINSASYKQANDTGFLGKLRERSQHRQHSNASFRILQERLKELSDRDGRYSLNPEKFREERRQFKEAVAGIRASNVSTAEISVQNTDADAEVLKAREQFRKDSNSSWLSRLRRDLYLGEAVSVIRDLISI